ncbi:MAG: DUF3574 domain-containing protein [Eubacterium sp.]|nr:DUF3574 domain-containing protein [Eubacterium sp.]
MKKILLILLITTILSVTGCEKNTNSEKQIDSSSADTILGHESESGLKYTLYIGLNDKDTYEQIISTEDAIDKANHICAEYAGGYTQFTARGGWTNDDGSLGHENTLVYIIYDISEDNLKNMLDEILKEFNQSSILVEENEISHIYYSGE